MRAALAAMTWSFGLGLYQPSRNRLDGSLGPRRHTKLGARIIDMKVDRPLAQT